MSELLISEKDLLFNINKIKNAEKNPNYKIIGVVKGNAYGLGLLQFSNLLVKNGIDFLAVATPEEALTLRKSGLKVDILLLTPIIDKNMVRILVNNDITLTVDSRITVLVADEIAKEQKKNVKVHVKIDTGLARYGFDYRQNDFTIRILLEYKNINYEGIYSHFSNSLAENKSWSKTQYARFCNTIKFFETRGLSFKFQHICNSSGYFKYPEMRMNCARIGSAFCGLATGMDYDLRRIGTLHTKITKIREIEKGESIGYANSYVAKGKMKIAILPTGYYEGIGRVIETQRYKFKSKAKKVAEDIKKLFRSGAGLYLSINGKLFEVVGQIGMHDIVINISKTDYKENDDVYIEARPALIESSVKRIYK